MAKPHLLTLLAALAASSIALPVVAQPGQVTPLAVTGKAPTSIAVYIRGKDAPTVRHDIRVAANTVCANAVNNRDISFVDQGWCADTAAGKAFHQFRAIERTQAFASVDAIRLSAW